LQCEEKKMARVLVIDDDAGARHVMCKMLKEVGHEPHGSAEPAQAIHEALTFKPDVLVADWLLKPDRTGLEVVETLRAAHPDLGVVFISGLPADEIEPKVRHLRRYRIVSKPCEFFELFEAVQQLAPAEAKT
jgi:CheY-like chemotaxis protein